MSALFLMGLGLAVSYSINNNKQNKEQLSILQKNIDFNSNRLKASHELRLLEFKNRLSRISSTSLYKKITGDLVTSSVLCNNGEKLIFSIPESVCNTCHENTFKQLEKISESIDPKNILVLVDNSKLRSTYVEFQERKSNINVMGVNFKELGFDIHYVPFFFILSPDSSVKNLFVPNSFDPELTFNYIEVVKKNYFQL